MKIEKGSTFVIVGDSVTDAGRARPVGEGLFNPHGTGYPNMVYGLLTALYPERMIRVVNQGCSGNTVRDLKARWQTDVLDLKPDWVSIMIGINDVWRQFDLPQMPEKHVLPEEYEKTLEELIIQTKPLVKGLVIMTPVFWEPNKNDPMAKRTAEYQAICKRLAEKHQVLFADAQKEADQILESCHPMYITWDRVHPNIPGHHALTRALLKVLDFDYNR